MKFYVLIRENKDRRYFGTKSQRVPVQCHWDRKQLEPQENEDSLSRWYILPAETKEPTP